MLSGSLTSFRTSVYTTGVAPTEMVGLFRVLIEIACSVLYGKNLEGIAHSEASEYPKIP